VQLKKEILKSIAVSSIILSGAFGAQAADTGELKQHVVGVFGGFTSVSGHTDATFGLEYEYRFTKQIGAGFVYEHTPGAHDSDGASVYMGQLHLHPWKELRLTAGYGKEKVHYEGSKSKDIWRVGVAYDFHVGQIGIAPVFNLDRVDGHTAKVFGLTLVKAF
jgi:hypothetical protein